MLMKTNRPNGADIMRI